ncbi:MAG: SRPBCC domain-containing protein [Phycisphaerales bacterium]|nr:SRPBCC domain-containing protein [Planctomycetota bacterium]
MKFLLILTCFISLLCHAGEDRVLRNSGVVQAPAAAIWKEFQTAEGIKKIWGVSLADVDFRIGGSIRTNYDPAGQIGDEGTITNNILAYEPERVLVLKSVAPPKAPDFVKAICESGWWVIRLDPISSSATTLTVTGMGFKDGPLYDQAYEFFKTGNQSTISQTQAAFDNKSRPEENRKTAERIKSLIGSWEFSQPAADGGVFRGKTDVLPLFGGKILFGTGFLGNERQLSQHSHMTIAQDPRSGEWTVWNFDQDGALTVGPIYAQGENKLIIDWNTYDKQGLYLPFRVEYTIADKDTIDTLIQGPPEANGSRGTIANVHYKRVARTVEPQK